MGLARLNRSITDDTDAVILELGANDMLEGISAKYHSRGARGDFTRPRSPANCRTFLAVRSQPSLGDEYKSAFAAMFSGLASEHNVLFYPAFDDAFMDNAQLKLPDLACTQPRPELKRSSLAYYHKSRR